MEPYIHHSSKHLGESELTFLSADCFALCNITSCLVSTASSESETSAEPSCELVARAQKLATESERSWALSQACGYYQRRCPPSELGKESCVRIMGESCSARVLQCSLLSTMQNLEPATQTRTQGEGERRASAGCLALK